jgi:hypothetical protein
LWVDKQQTNNCLKGHRPPQNENVKRKVQTSFLRKSFDDMMINCTRNSTIVIDAITKILLMEIVDETMPSSRILAGGKEESICDVP